MAETTSKPVGNKDADGSFKQYFSSHAIVADLLNNVVLKDGMHVLTENIVTLDSAKVYTGRDGVVVQRQVDVLDKAIVQTNDPENGSVYVISAIQAQSEVDYSMVFRCMEDAALIYRWQISELRHKEYELRLKEYESRLKEWVKLHPNEPFAESKPVQRYYMKQTDVLIPVVNIVLYLGSGRWTGKTNLRDLLVNSPVREMASDFSIRVIAPHDLGLTDQDLMHYTTDLGTVLLVLKNQNNVSTLQSMFKSDLGLSPDGIQLIEAVTGARFRDHSTNKGGKSMPSGLVTLLQNNAVMAIHIAHELNNNTPVEEICTKYDVTPDTVEAIRDAVNSLKN